MNFYFVKSEKINLVFAEPNHECTLYNFVRDQLNSELNSELQ